MKWYLPFILVYMLGFAGVLFINISVGPVTFGLSVFRAAVWPVWVLTGRPKGQPLDSGRSDYD